MQTRPPNILSPDDPLKDPSVVCYRCGYGWELVWVVARSLFRQIGPRRYECGPTNCPRCNPRVGTYWEAARGAVAALVNAPPEAMRPRAGENGSSPANLRPIQRRSTAEQGETGAF